MQLKTFGQFMEMFSPGRTRARYEKLTAQIGSDAIILTVSYSDRPLWLVKDIDAAKALTAQGLTRSQVWTLHEVQEFLGAFSASVSTLVDAAYALSGDCSSDPRHD